jgi:hypothetical protein
LERASMTDVAAVTATPETSQGDPAAMSTALEQLGIFRGVEEPSAKEAAPVETQAVTATQQEQAVVAAVEVDPLLFTDAALSTPEGIKAARAAIDSELKKAKDLRQKSHNAHAAAEAREAKFKKTKEQVLSDKHALATQFGILQSEIKAIQSGDPDAFINAIGRLSGHSDPHKFWRDASLRLASGGKLQEPEKPTVDPVVQQRLDAVERHIAEEGLARTNAEIAARRAEQVHFAQNSAEHPLVRNYATANPQQLDEAITYIRTQEFQRTGRPIDAGTACGMLERELNVQYELLQRAAPQTGEKVATGSVPVVGRETNALAKPGMTASSSQAQPQVTAIPASLSAQPGAARRPTTEREKREAIANSLPSTFWRNLGFSE